MADSGSLRAANPATTRRLRSRELLNDSAQLVKVHRLRHREGHKHVGDVIGVSEARAAAGHHGVDWQSAGASHSTTAGSIQPLLHVSLQRLVGVLRTAVTLSILTSYSCTALVDNSVARL